MSSTPAATVNANARLASYPEVRTLHPADFDAVCAELMQMIERDFVPTLLVGVRTGGLIVAEAMARAASNSLPVLPLTCRRRSTRLKSLTPGLRFLLSRLPPQALDRLRQAEHRLLTSRRRQASPPRVDQEEVAAIESWLRRSRRAERVVITDDAVDSGATLAAVLQALDGVCPPATRLRTAAITVTQAQPQVRPTYTLYSGVLCRFPWSFDALG